MHCVMGRLSLTSVYRGSLLNLCVTVAAFPLHFSHEYSISSICQKMHMHLTLCSLRPLAGIGFLRGLNNRQTPSCLHYLPPQLVGALLTLKKRSRESWMERSGRVFFRRGRSMDRSLNCSLLVTTSPQLERNTPNNTVPSLDPNR